VLAILRLVLVAIFIVCSALVGLLICLVRPFYVPNAALFASWYGWAAWIFGLKVEVRQAPEVTAAMPCVFLANHQNNYDLFTISKALLPGTVTIGKKSLKWIPFFGQLYWLSGNILIDRANKSKAVGTMQGAVDRIVQDKVSVWVFPEGTRSYGRGLLPFKTGAFHIAHQAKVPLVPICMSNTSKVRLNKWNNGRVIIEIMPPVYPEAGTPARELAETIRQQMADKIKLLDSEVATDYTADSLTVTG
jgi:1-acyl-sn-glycerol-3-phosphate acyltransferase